MRRRQRIVLILLALVLTSAAGPPAAAEERTGPNFVVILADDLGYGDLSVYGNEAFETPNLDALAAEGLRFTEFYANGTVCSPTRAALMTGRYQQRAGVDGVITAANHRDEGLHVDEVTLPQLLSEAGYATGMYGKWHVGYQPRFNPVRHGFDDFRGFVAGNVDYFSHVDQTGVYDWWHGDEKAEEPGYVTHLITEHGVRFIKQHHEQPFLLYLAHAAPHYPYQGPDDSAERAVDGEFKTLGSRKDRRAAYAEMMRELDKGVGEIVATLREHEIERETLVLFFSDNGPNRYGSNDPLRGHKGSLFEGGVRVPAMAWWPGTIEAGQTSDARIIGMDVMPTLLELADVPLPKGHTLDGVSMVPAMQGEAMPDRPLFWHFGSRRAMRDGDWKMVIDPRRADEPMLFNLDDDLSETEDVSADHPQQLERMLKAYRDWHADVTTGATPQPPPGG